MPGPTRNGRKHRPKQRSRPAVKPTGRRVAAAAMAVALGILILVRIDGCSNRAPQQPEDICAIFGEHRSWYRASRQVARKWQVPEPILLAVIYQESTFRADARPPRRRLFGLIPTRRPSSAYGFGQVLDGTWEEYLQLEAPPGARRDRFHDVVPFVGWYLDRIHRQTGIAKDDAHRLYLAYHEGPGGYRRGTYRGKAFLNRAAQRVEDRADRYERQLAACRDRLDRPWWKLW